MGWKLSVHCLPLFGTSDRIVKKEKGDSSGHMIEVSYVPAFVSIY